MKEYNLGDIVKLKKHHPCGGDSFEVIRIGADIKLKCLTCAHIIMINRCDMDKKVKLIDSK